MMDAAGNIAEWTTSLETENGERFVLKSASYNSAPIFCQLDVDFASPRHFRYGHYGFRLALTI
jgi:formylglycine-generating enzyme required for sulfatase activity